MKFLESEEGPNSKFLKKDYFLQVDAVLKIKKLKIQKKVVQIC